MMLKRHAVPGVALIIFLSLGGMMCGWQWMAKQRDVQVPMNIRPLPDIRPSPDTRLSQDVTPFTGDRLVQDTRSHPINRTRSKKILISVTDQLSRISDDIIEPRDDRVDPILDANIKHTPDVDEYYKSLFSRELDDFKSFYSSASPRITISVVKGYLDLWRSTWMALSDKGLQHFANRSIHELSSSEPYLTRRTMMRKNCQSLKPSRHIDLSRMVYDDKHKLVMCVVPKNACSSWKRFFFYLTGEEKNSSKLEDISRDHLVLGNGPLRTLDKLSKVDALRRLSTYTTFVVARNPYHRLVSAHSSKFTSRSPNQSYKKRLGRWIATHQAKQHMHGVSIGNSRFINATRIARQADFLKLNKVEQQEVLDFLRILNTGEITFTQFVRFIVGSLRREPEFMLDVHWRSQETLCNPCVMNYDYVIRFEDLAKDSNRLLAFTQRNEPKEDLIRFKSSTSPAVGEAFAQKFISVLPAEAQRFIAHVYRNDFKILGYDV